MKSLVVYFSRAGENYVDGSVQTIEKGYTEIIAQKIAKQTNSHIFQLEPVIPYPKDYKECVKRAKEETKVDYLHPEFKVDEYNVIFLGFPNWWRSYPKIIGTFISNNNWEGKIIIPFCTNEEGTMGVADRELQTSAKGAIIKPGFACKGFEAINCDEKLNAWLEKVFK